MKWFVCLVITFFAYSALAKKVIYRKSQKVDFSETDINGVVRSPDSAYLHQKRGVKFLPLYKVKSNFDKKIKNSVDYLR